MMMDPAVKTAMAFCVLLAGVCAALLFGRDRARPALPGPVAAEKLLIPHRDGKKASGVFIRNRRQTASDRRYSLREPESSPYPRPASAGGGRSLTVLSPSQLRQSPPPLAEEYPRPDRPADSRWGRSMDMMLPVPTPINQMARTHKIVDGDTLTALAERYLGSSLRAGEIFEANRDLLFDPQLLPIGVELKIPFTPNTPRVYSPGAK